jgi:hypothetical protein
VKPVDKNDNDLIDPEGVKLNYKYKIKKGSAFAEPFFIRNDISVFKGMD